MCSRKAGTMAAAAWDKDVESVEPGVIPVTVKRNFGEWHLRLPCND